MFVEKNRCSCCFAVCRVWPEFHVAFYNRGEIHYRMARHAQAEADLRECLRLCPDFELAERLLVKVKKATAVA